MIRRCTLASPKFQMFLLHCAVKNAVYRNANIFMFPWYNPYCYHGNRKILLPWGIQLHHIFYSDDGCTLIWPYTTRKEQSPGLSCSYTLALMNCMTLHDFWDALFFDFYGTPVHLKLGDVARGFPYFLSPHATASQASSGNHRLLPGVIWWIQGEGDNNRVHISSASGGSLQGKAWL